MSRPTARPGEFEIIERWLRPLATEAGAFALTDDAGLISPVAGEDLVITADMVAEGIHFFPDDAPWSVARKALAVNLSDLAAKGGAPAGYLLCLALTDDFDTAWLDSFVGGLKEEQERHDITLLGGDTIRSGDGVTIAITAIGRVPAGTMVRRSGARPGDAVYVSGTIGDAALGLAVRKRNFRIELAGDGSEYLLDRYLHPQPRLTLAPVLRVAASAALDVSDGLVGDLAHLCRASGARARIEADRVPLSAAARQALASEAGLLETVLTGGDDYEILATIPAEMTGQFEKDAAAAGVAVTRIGEMSDGEGVTVVGSDGQELSFQRPSHVQF